MQVVQQNQQNKYPSLFKRWIGPGLLCSKFYLLCFWAVLKNVAYYVQYYPHNHSNYATVYMQFYYFNDSINIVRLQPVVYIIRYAMLQCSYIWPNMLNIIMLMRKLVPHFVPIWGRLLYHKWRLFYIYIDYTDILL